MLPPETPLTFGGRSELESRTSQIMDAYGGIGPYRHAAPGTKVGSPRSVVVPHDAILTCGVCGVLQGGVL